MVDENFRGTQQQWRLYTEMARMGSESLLSERGSQALSSQGSLGVTASTDDLAALSFAWASPELMPDSEVCESCIFCCRIFCCAIPASQPPAAAGSAMITNRVSRNCGRRLLVSSACPGLRHTVGHRGTTHTCSLCAGA